MISITQAALAGIQRLREPQWANPEDYILIDIINRKPGPWVHLYSPINGPVCQQDNPQDILLIGGKSIHEEIYEPYTGVPSEDEPHG